jgi:hypothetical protein|tara:strand:+ start:978 stop:1094 length:117 start_codon:yes stop_codon:yes gene_type:complete
MQEELKEDPEYVKDVENIQAQKETFLDTKKVLMDDAIS